MRCIMLSSEAQEPPRCLRSDEIDTALVRRRSTLGVEVPCVGRQASTSRSVPPASSFPYY